MKYTSEQLRRPIETIQKIGCSYCRHTDTYNNGTLEGATESFFKEGWRSTSKNTYCPKCAKKKLKQ